MTAKAESEPLTTDQKAGMIAGLATPVLVAIITVLMVPVMLWEAWAANTVLRWHYPAFAIGTVPLAALIQVFRVVFRPRKRPDVTQEEVIGWVLVPAVLLFTGWLFTKV